MPTSRTEDDRARAEAQQRLRRGRLITSVVVGVLVLVVAATALLGGFRARTDLLTAVAVGSVISTGPYEVSLDRATLTHHTSNDRWEITASGMARTTGSTSIAPDVGGSGFVYARSTTTREVQASSSVEIGDAIGIDHLDNLTPGLAPVPWSMSFTFTKDPGDAVFVAVFGQQYTKPYIFGDEMGWRATRDASTMTLPLRRLPDEEF